jgi:hypothetical protein
MKKSIVKSIMGILLVMGFLAGCSSAPASAPAVSAMDLTGVTSYYVRANGNDRNSGISEDAPFQTLERAVQAASTTAVKKITVIGTLTGYTKIENTDPTPLLTRKVMYGNMTVLSDSVLGTAEVVGSYDDPDPEEILITGKPGATGAERAVLRYAEGAECILLVTRSTVRLEHIEISGSSSGYTIGVTYGAVTLAEGAVATNNTRSATVMALRGIIIMRDNASVSGNEGTHNVGVYLANGSVLVMRDEASITNNKSANNGGGLAMEGSSAYLLGNAKISGNSAGNAGGGIITFPDEKNGYIPQITMQENAGVKGNSAKIGGGILLNEGTLTMNDTSQITDNTASDTGGGLFGVGETVNVNRERSAVLSGNTAPEFPDSNFDFD